MRERLDRVWPSLVALVGTVGVVLALLVVFGDNTGDGAGEDVVASDDNGAPEDDTGEESGTDEPGADETEPTDEATGEPDGDADEDGEDGGTDEPGTEPTPAPPELRTPLGIANQTSVEGLELQARDRIEAGGWEVEATSGFNGSVPETTVYYPPGLEESAQALARQFPEIGRVEETFDGLNPTRLVVVLVEDYIDEVES
ncbi:LytR C-terminal domain-containing protein [Phytoactinopolyspora alkaliphila]|uniref:LytR C-terminal domain-containing protein n=1 Tax=Phytoactinopolyspora alkaliphila TaxID=1783498 RepID=A0A6N9YL36_9ACTN|nr:LytR C-terminal domain-containing protein [Phytoactinopolyspora alkaliphila]NED95589.1 LytR C-terminal domain-containing protein [Phytoactinopolyspora alkaliphila]